ncbi:MAG: hypothetical protein E7356_00405 [Clostridiales bacterium]|nr:hypothetical protein [Clostridiales bacterium]
MDYNKIKTYLSFSIKSGKIIFGYDNLMSSKKYPKCVIMCSSQSNKVATKVARYCENLNIRLITFKDVKLADIIGRDNCKVIGLLDENLVSAILNELDNGK